MEDWYVSQKYFADMEIFPVASLLKIGKERLADLADFFDISKQRIELFLCEYLCTLCIFFKVLFNRFEVHL